MITEIIKIKPETKDLQKPLMKNISENDWFDCLLPLQYLLLPVGITNLIPHKRVNKFWMIWSIFFGASLLFIPTYLLNPEMNVYLTLSNDNPYRYYLLKICFAIQNFGVFSTYIFLKFYYFPKNHFQSLHKHLFHYLQNEDVIILAYYNYLYKYCKSVVIAVHSYIILESVYWGIVAANN